MTTVTYRTQPLIFRGYPTTVADLEAKAVADLGAYLDQAVVFAKANQTAVALTKTLSLAFPTLVQQVLAADLYAALNIASKVGDVPGSIWTDFVALQNRALGGLAGWP